MLLLLHIPAIDASIQQICYEIGRKARQSKGFRVHLKVYIVVYEWGSNKNGQ